MLSSPPPPQAPAAQLKVQLAWLEDMEKHITERVASEDHMEKRAAELLTLERGGVLAGVSMTSSQASNKVLEVKIDGKPVQIQANLSDAI